MTLHCVSYLSTTTRRPLGQFRAIMCPLMLLLPLANIATANVLVHETFSDNNITDGSPAVWQGCFPNCGSDPPTADFSIDNGEFNLTVRAFAMWRLLEVDGVELEPQNTWSIRARIEPQRGDNGEFIGRESIVGVGTDQFYWAAGVKNSAAESNLSNGRFTDSAKAPESNVSYFDEWAVQIDVYPDHLESHRWLMSDPSDVASGSWRRGSPIVPGLPVIWGNWGGSSIFREVVVATEPMGVGGDFDRDGELHLTDVEALSDVIRSGSNDPRYNLTSDEVVDELDLDVWVHQIKKTYFGDANLDKSVEFADFLALSSNFGQVGGWAEGDFDGSGDVQFPDFLLLGDNFGKVAAATAAVPEPTSFLTTAFAALAVVLSRRPALLTVCMTTVGKKVQPRSKCKAGPAHRRT